MHGLIEKQSASYRRGLVLGLTMAEIMLLLVFCLLIAMGVSISHEYAKRKSIERQFDSFKANAAINESVIDAIRKDPRLQDLRKGKSNAEAEAAIDEFWRDLIESYDTVQEIKKFGLNSQEIKGTAELYAKLHKYREQLHDPEKIIKDESILQALRNALSDHSDLLDHPTQLGALIDRAKGLEDQPKEDPSGHNWPPIIRLSEADGYFFSVGKADLAPDFERHLRADVVPRLLEIINRYKVDVVDVIGNTDEQPLSERSSNLDATLLNVVRGSDPVSILKPADNAGLGLARAVAVVKVLTSDPRLKGYKILPLSGAQLINTDDSLTEGTDRGNVKERRRIEIRARRAD